MRTEIKLYSFLIFYKQFYFSSYRFYLKQFCKVLVLFNSNICSFIYCQTPWLFRICLVSSSNNSMQLQIKLGWALFVTYTIIQSIIWSEMCSLHLTHPSVHTWSSGQPTVQRPGSSHGLPVGAGIRTHNLGLPRVTLGFQVQRSIH